MKNTELRLAYWRMLFVALALSGLIPLKAAAWDISTSQSAATAAPLNTTATTLPPTSCTDCHTGTTVENHHSTSYFINGQCNQCHVGITVSGDCSACHAFGLNNTHHNSAPALAGNCAQCHSNVGDYQNCLTCHLGKSRTRHHQIASSMGFACRQCHTTIVQQATGDCSVCHVSPVRERHHSLVATGVSCKTCHTSYVETPNGCKSCHNFFAPNPNPHHGPAADAYGMTCMSCHPLVWNPATSAYAVQLPTVEQCKSCHETQVGAAGPIGAKHHMTLPAQNNECGVCHQGITPVPTCTGCHSTANGGVAAIHHASDLYLTGECLTCHTGADAQNIACANCHANPPHHLQPQAYAGDCKYCHSTIQNLGTGCNSCHTSPVREIHHAAPLDSLGGDCSACHGDVSSPTVCSNCHQATPHHTTTWSQTGDCAHCHKVPAETADRPKQAACRACHGTSMHAKGGPIKDYGACAACHHTDPFHAKPATSSTGYGGDDDEGGSRNYGPGRNKFNLFYSVNRGGEGKYRPTSQLSFTKVQISHEGQTYTVPSFDTTSSVTLSECTRCHGDNRAKVSCTNALWTAHVTKGYVSLALAQLAESTYNGSLCSSPATGTLCTVASTGTYIEAENYNALGTTFTVQTSTTGANGGKYLKGTVTSTSSTSGTAASYTLKFGETGTYYLWFRGNDSRNSSYNSLWYGLNGTRVGDVQTPASDSNWRWVNARSANGPTYAAITISTTGTHTLNIWSREANFQLDGIYITKVSGTLPGGISATIPTGAAVISPTSCGGTTTAGTTTETTPPPPPAPVNLALNKSATASRYESGYEASKAVDGSATTRWWARSSNSHYIRVDLGSSQSISKVTVAWNSYYARSYQVQTSTDGSNWTTVANITSATGGTRDHTFTARNARYVRVYCSSPNTSDNGYSINELSIFQ